jgi:hypothetical protein
MILGGCQARSRAGYPFELRGGRERGLERSRERTIICRRSGMENQVSAHPGYGLQRGLDGYQPRMGFERLRYRSPIGVGWVHPLSLSARDQSIKPQRADSPPANMIALMSATTKRQ